MLIVDDQPGEVPPEVAQMEEMVMVMQYFDMAVLTQIQQPFNTYMNFAVTGTSASVLLRNARPSSQAA